MTLKNKKLVLCITGSIACYKSIELYRSLKKEGASVTIILSSSASKFISPYIFKSFGEEVYADDAFEIPLAHIELAKTADAIVVAPATYNTINKIACGIADSLITLTVSALGDKPCIIVPAMNNKMYSNEILQENIKKLIQKKYYFVNPTQGELACGDFGEGKFPEIKDIVFEIESVFKNKKFKDKKILITAGATREYIDPVRFISNASSGKMGMALADEAIKLGAEVTLIACNIDIQNLYINKKIKLIKAASFNDLRESLINEFPKNDILIMAAAVSDFGVKEKSPLKIKKANGCSGNTTNIHLNLIQNDDLLKLIAKDKKQEQIIFGFAAETDNIIENAQKKFKEKSLDYIFVNDVTKNIIGSSENEGYLIKIISVNKDKKKDKEKDKDKEKENINGRDITYDDNNYIYTDKEINKNSAIIINKTKNTGETIIKINTYKNHKNNNNEGYNNNRWIEDSDNNLEIKRFERMNKAELAEALLNEL
ncbi:MAG: bifunctional phosphopantothenoylcysteine decarboxylase/phosphopantothenate--cysteine ligase CoaBC [Candidatus Acididesulfobacter diazotrophicus]|jgi:phosphopantothenoylcysteine decarboxylase/phosphopantothenate--cysteine ligase|uniref:Coenzyme A biosynthesis bifunctional protein CoaBC n=1 Tax=Candidatus Acididesulfobacter diazotrophicus TaxID=2597226 RepID=A0A519BM09_9DELT|nr:MAG: bifunctional phosphopantothenoylcysteine decarboxylase/phosphopantothenate--cysteine ligase CoaBC [Candidatus Acididesulfobacter diazotrophicus]